MPTRKATEQKTEPARPRLSAVAKVAPEVAALQTSKAQVAIVPPGDPLRFVLLGTTNENNLVSATKRQNATIYYQMYRQHPMVRAGIEKIAKVVVSNGWDWVPTEADEDLNDEHAKALRAFARRSSFGQLLRLASRDLLIYGEAYWFIQKDHNKVPLRAYRLHPKYMDIRVNYPDGNEIVAYRYGPIYQDANAVEYDVNDIVRFKMDDPDSDLYGLSPLESLTQTVTADLFAMKYNEAFFENAAQTGLVFNMKGSNSDEVARNREWLDQNYVGATNAHRPIILEGDIDIHKSVSSHQDMQFLEARILSRQEILSVLDLPPEKVGIIDHSNRSTAKESDNTFRQEAIAPFQTMMAEEINNALILGMFDWDDTLFQFREVAPRDELSAMQLFAEAERMGVMSPNDIAKKLGLPTQPGGDVRFLQTSAGLIPLSMLQAAAEGKFLGMPGAGGGPANPLGGLGTGEDPQGENFDPGANPTL